MPTDKIAYLKQNQIDTFSKSSIRWLEYEAKERNINIQHAMNGGEVKILGHKVDGYHSESKTIFQFHGCWYHGCPKCYDPETLNNKTNTHMHELLQRTKTTTKIFQDNDYNVVEIWTCEWKMIDK